MEWIKGVLSLFVCAVVITVGVLFAISIAGCSEDDYAPPVENGGACTFDEQCASEVCATSFEDGVVIQEGLCTEACTWEPDSCPEGQVCLQYNATGEKLCFERCAGEDDCRVEDGWACAVVGWDGTSACIPPL